MLKSIRKFYQSHGDNTLFILACLIFFWPLGLLLLWKHRKWGIKSRSIVTSVFIGSALVIGIAVYNAPPSIALADTAITSNYTTDDEYMMLSGEISPLHNPTLLINNQAITLSEGGEFTYKLVLPEGDTDVRIVAKSDKGVDTKAFKVHRATSAELVERKVKAEAEEAARKLAADKATADKKRSDEARALKVKQDTIASMPICDGKNVKASCKHEGTIYKTFIYYPAVAEKTHIEKATTYKVVVTSYCTLCNDGTYSPSCATGRGACSWHGGVAQWNAPRTSNVPEYTDRIIVDTPAAAEYYEKVLDPQFN